MRIVVHASWIESGNVFGAEIILLGNGDRLEMANLSNTFSDMDDPVLQIGAKYDNNNVLLTLNTVVDTVFRYKIISVL
jgi:hypothetical protein